MTQTLYRVDIDYHPRDPRRARGVKFSLYFTDLQEAGGYIAQCLANYDEPTIVNLGDVFAHHADDAAVFAEDETNCPLDFMPEPEIV